MIFCFLASWSRVPHSWFYFGLNQMLFHLFPQLFKLCSDHLWGIRCSTLFPKMFHLVLHIYLQVSLLWGDARTPPTKTIQFHQKLNAPKAGLQQSLNQGSEDQLYWFQRSVTWEYRYLASARIRAKSQLRDDKCFAIHCCVETKQPWAMKEQEASTDSPARHVGMSISDTSVDI